MTSTDEFRRRAFFEAHRYGGDEWVFVRELLQNARDAGARRVDLVVERADGIDRVICRDDGSGMSFDHARRFLFTLYASSKGDRRDMAGRFGIGFWAVLRYRPSEILVRSAPVEGAAWQLRVSGDLETVERTSCSRDRGTEVELVRRAHGTDPVAEVWRAVRHDAHHLRRLDADSEVLDVRVNSRPATAEIDLEPPALELVRMGRRAAVALADRARVDLLAHGLRVRTTATLDELLTRPDGRWRRRSVVPDGLVPRVVLDSRRLQVLMARGDARSDRELRRLVALGRRGIRRLVRGQLDREAGLGALGRASVRVLDLMGSPWLRRTAAALAAVAALVIGARWVSVAGRPGGDGGRTAGASTTVSSDASFVFDVAARYRGPSVSPLASGLLRPTIRYRPERAEPMFGVFRVTAIDDEGRVFDSEMAADLGPYVGARCAGHCLDVAVELNGAPRRLRLPVPTGHLVDPSSVRTSVGSAVLWATPDGEPVVEFDRPVRGRVEVEYRTGAGVDPGLGRTGPWPSLPRAADDLAERLTRFDRDRAASTARDWLRQRVIYDTSVEAVERHVQAADRGLDFAERCFAVGAGDCDVQNALLASILDRAGIPVRMAVGFVGAGGRALPGLHAWVEYGGEDGRWRSIDASRDESSGEITAPAGAAVSAAPAVDGTVGVIDNPGGPPPSRPRPTVGRWLVVVLLSMAAVTVVVVRRSRTTVRDLRLAGAPDLASLLRGALARPEAYRDVPELFARRIVPVIGGSAVSLERARALGRRGRLTAGSGSSGFAGRAVEAGHPVIDTGRAAGRAVGSVLGAVDLDRWDGLMEHGSTHPVTERVERAAKLAGQQWSIVVAEGCVGDVDVLDGALVGLGGRRRLVAIDAAGALWTRVAAIAADRPAAAALMLAGSITERLGRSPEWARCGLPGLAAAALEERTGRAG